MRIWSGYTKFIRSQCNKYRVIDSIYFGYFFKKESNIIETDPDKKGNFYGFYNDPRKNLNYSEFKNVINQENFEKIPSYLSDKDQV